MRGRGGGQQWGRSSKGRQKSIGYVHGTWGSFLVQLRESKMMRNETINEEHANALYIYISSLRVGGGERRGAKEQTKRVQQQK